jgi:hypothetical protein
MKEFMNFLFWWQLVVKQILRRRFLEKLRYLAGKKKFSTFMQL